MFFSEEKSFEKDKEGYEYLLDGYEAYIEKLKTELTDRRDGILRDLEINPNLCGCIMPVYDALQVSALKMRLENARPIGITIWSI